MTAKPAKSTTVNPREIAQFARIADEWWDENGKFKPLHKLNPVRLSYVKDKICAHYDRPSRRMRALEGLKILDIGCGGGLVSEPLARMGATVTGIDAAAESIAVAQAHARQNEVGIDYQTIAAEDLAKTGQRFDVITALEIVEHVEDVELFLASCEKLLKKGGLLILSTLSRTKKSYLLGILAAEYLLRWVPKGTHDWNKFLKPSELALLCQDNGFKVTDLQGLIYNPLRNEFRLHPHDLDVNYFLTANKTA